MKKVISLFLATVTLALLLCSCSGPAKVKVNGVKIHNEIYTYFENTLPAENDEKASEESIKNAIIRYVAINSEFENRGLSLDSDLKGAISVAVNDLWHLYSNYYNEIGVSKQTIYKIELSKEYEAALLADYYSDISEDEIKAYFKKNYAGIRFVTGYLFNVDENGVSVPMTDAEKTALTDAYKSAAALINEGSLIEETLVTLGENADVHDTLVNAFSDDTFPKGFWKNVEKIDAGKASAVVIDDYIFLVQRVDVFDKTYGYYENNRTACLEAMKGDEFAKVVDGWSKNYKAD